MSKIKIAVIGCGNIANTAHIPAYMANDKAEILYFCDILAEKAEAAVAKYGCGKAITDYMEALNDPDVTAVSICTPNNLHNPVTIAALEKGKDVLCEKPAARTYQEAFEMQKACEKTGKILNIGVVNRFNDNVNQVKEIIDKGDLGEIYHVYVSFRAHRSIPGLGGAFTTREIAGGGALIDWGVHFLDIVMYCCGDPAPKTVSSEVFSRLGQNIREYSYTYMWAGPPKTDGIYNVDDSMTALVRTDGPVISVHGAWAQNIGKREMYIDFMGTKAGIRLDYDTKAFIKYSSESGMLTETKYSMNSKDMFQNEIDAFIECIETGERLPSDIRTNIKTSKMMDAMYRSAEIHKEIEL